MTGKDDEARVSHVYVRDDASCWVPALQLKTVDGKATISMPEFKTEQEMMSCGQKGKVRYHDNQVINLKDYPHGVLPMQNVDSNGRLEEYKDMVELPFLHEVR